MRYVVKVMFDGEASYVPINGIKISRCRAYEEDGRYFLEVYSTKHRADSLGQTEKSFKERVTAKVELFYGKTVSGTYYEAKWEYARGKYNVINGFTAEMEKVEDAYENAKQSRERPSPLGYILVALGDKDNELEEFVKKEEKNVCYYAERIFLHLAYKNGWGVEPDEKKALYYGLTSRDPSIVLKYYHQGLGEKLIKSDYWFEEQIRGEGHAIDYFIGNMFIEAGMREEGEDILIHFTNCIHWDYPEFYEKDNHNQRHWSSVVHEQVAHIYLERGQIEDAIHVYGIHLAFEEYDDDRKINYITMESDYDENPYDPSHWEVRRSDRKVSREMVDIAVNKGDAFAKKLLDALNQ